MTCKHWIVETLFTYGWENCWVDDGESPVTFGTEGEAVNYLAGYVSDSLEAVKNGDIEDFDTNDYRVSLVEDFGQ